MTQELVARTTPGDPAAGDPPPGVAASAFGSPRRSLWGVGEALRIELPAPWPDHVDRVADALGAIRSEGADDEPGAGPVAFGALPYDRTAAASLVVPRVVHGRTADGTRWTTTIGADGDGPGAGHVGNGAARRDPPSSRCAAPGPTGTGSTAWRWPPRPSSTAA